MKMLDILLPVCFLSFSCNSNSNKTEAGNAVADSKKGQEEILDTAAPPPMNQGRYGIKSAKMVKVTKMPNAMGNSEATIYFDNYGSVTYTETVTHLSMKGAPVQPKQFSLNKADMIYSWTEGKKEGTKMDIQKLKSLDNLDFEKLGKEMLADMKMKKAGTEIFLGKTCDVLEINSEHLGKGRILTWKNIPLYTDITTMGMKVISEVKDLVENPVMDQSKFEIPVNIVFKEFSMNLKDD